MTTPISELELSVRTCNMLLNAGITTVEELAEADLATLLLGRSRRINVEIKEALAIHQNHLDRQIQPDLWQFVLANKEAIDLLRQGRATLQLKIELKEQT